jgi:hypothetical protein
MAVRDHLEIQVWPVREAGPTDGTKLLASIDRFLALCQHRGHQAQMAIHADKAIVLD